MTAEAARRRDAYRIALSNLRRIQAMEPAADAAELAAAAAAAVDARTFFVATWCQMGLWPHSRPMLEALAGKLFSDRSQGPGRDSPRTVALEDAGPFQALVSHGLAVRVPSSRSPRWRRYAPTAKGARLLRSCGYAVVLDRERQDYDFGGPDEAAAILKAELPPVAKRVRSGAREP